MCTVRYCIVYHRYFVASLNVSYFASNHLCVMMIIHIVVLFSLFYLTKIYTVSESRINAVLGIYGDWTVIVTEWANQKK